LTTGIIDTDAKFTTHVDNTAGKSFKNLHRLV
jgi:hypothetical protein